MLIFVLVLAVMGHVLYVINVWRGEEYKEERLYLGVLNAVLMMGLLVLARRIVSRWLREEDFFVAVAGALDRDLEVGEAEIEGEAGGGNVCKSFRLWGGGVCVVGGVEMWLLLRELPLSALVRR